MIKTAFVTGAGGFIGSHLTEALLTAGWRVKALVHYNSRSFDSWLEHCPPLLRNELKVIRGDITNSRQMRGAIDGCDTVFHLGALISIPYSYLAPDSYPDSAESFLRIFHESIRIHYAEFFR